MIELSITMGLLLVVVGGLLGVFTSVQRSAVFSSARAESLDNMRLAMDRITKEVRQATSIAATSTASTLDMQTYINGTSTHIVLTAANSKITRTVGTSTTTILVDLSSTAVFAYSPAVPGTTLVTVTLSVKPVRRPETTLKLISEIRLRNGVTT